MRGTGYHRGGTGHNSYPQPAGDRSECKWVRFKKVFRHSRLNRFLLQLGPTPSAAEIVNTAKPMQPPPQITSQTTGLTSTSRARYLRSTIERGMYPRNVRYHNEWPAWASVGVIGCQPTLSVQAAATTPKSPLVAEAP